MILLVLLLSGQMLAQSEPPDSVSQLEATKLQRQKSPMGALMRSVAVPGWGQFYNGKYLKSVVIFGAESFFIYKAAHWWIETEDQYDLVQSLPEDQQASAFSLYQSYRGKRNDYLWLTALSVFVSMFDAYVDAHLSGFDVDLTPEFEDGKPSASLTFSFSF